MRNFLWCYYRWFITSLKIFILKNVKKECNVFKIILVQDFCPLKIKITQFPDGFRLNICETEIINLKFHKNCNYAGKILKISCVRRNFVKFDIHFLGLP